MNLPASRPLPRKIVEPHHETEDGDLSDLDLAMMLEDHFGSDSLLKGPSGIWLFEGLVWRRLQDDEIKAIAVSVLAEQVDKVMRPPRIQHDRYFPHPQLDV